MIHAIPMMVVLPLAGAFFIPMVSRRAAWVPDAVGNAVMVVLAVISFGLIGREGIYHVGGWPTPLGIDLRLDGLTVILLLAVNGIGLCAALFSVSYMELYTSKFRYYSLFLFMVAGMNGVIITGDLFNLYVFMEIAAIASYALVAFGCEHEELEASFKYAVLGGVASSLILIGIAVVYMITGSLNMAQIADRIQTIGLTPPILLALCLFVAGFGLKAALVPFHAWLPDAHPSAPAPVSAMLSGVLIKAIGVYVMARLFFNVFGPTSDLLAVMRLLGVLSMVIGVLLAVGQWDMKRLFAYHSISQIGYVMLGLGLGTPLGLAGGLFHLLNHSVFKSLLFLNAGSVEYSTGRRNLKQLGGLARILPLTGGTTLVASMSIGGVPPFNGFWSKLIIIFACIRAGFYGLAGWAVLVSVITLASFLKVLRYGFYEAPAEKLRVERSTAPLMAVALLLLAISCLAMSLFVVTGLESPVLVDRAVEALSAGVFGM